MDKLILNWGFLYFPEDKSTYIPAAIEMVLLFVVVFILFKWLRKNSVKKVAEIKELEERALAERDARLKEKEKKELEERAQAERDAHLKEEEKK